MERKTGISIEKLSDKIKELDKILREHGMDLVSTMSVNLVADENGEGTRIKELQTYIVFKDE